MTIDELIARFKAKKITKPTDAAKLIHELSDHDIRAVFSNYHWVGASKQDPFFVAGFSEDMYSAIFKALAHRLGSMPKNAEQKRLVAQMLRYQSSNDYHYGRKGVRLGLDKETFIRLLSMLSGDTMTPLSFIIVYLKLFSIMQELDCMDAVTALHPKSERPEFRRTLIQSFRFQMSTNELLFLIDSQPDQYQAALLIVNNTTGEYRSYFFNEMRYYFQLLNNNKDRILGSDMAAILIDAKRFGLYGRLFSPLLLDALIPLLEHCYQAKVSMDLLLPPRDFYLKNTVKNPALVGELIFNVSKMYAPACIPAVQIQQMKHGKEGLLEHFKQLRTMPERQAFLDQAMDKTTSLGAIFYAWRSNYSLRPFFQRERVIDKLVKEAEKRGVYPTPATVPQSYAAYEVYERGEIAMATYVGKTG